ncbi:MAG: hypothetical protein OWR62_16880, partial [Sulfobacillus thermotolerans]|nr:hypothetical protein [Sulfobacillus thermotolerans]
VGRFNLGDRLGSDYGRLLGGVTSYLRCAESLVVQGFPGGTKIFSPKILRRNAGLDGEIWTAAGN